MRRTWTSSVTRRPVEAPDGRAERQKANNVCGGGPGVSLSVQNVRALRLPPCRSGSLNFSAPIMGFMSSWLSFPRSANCACLPSSRRPSNPTVGSRIFLAFGRIMQKLSRSRRLVLLMARRYRALGSLSVTVDSEERFLGPKVGSLLAVLLVNNAGPVSKERLAIEIWGENPPADPEAALHNLVGRLRSVVGDDLVTQSPGYALKVDQFDVRNFEQSVESARVEGSIELYEEAEALWGGEPYDGFEDQPSVRIEIERLNRLKDRAAIERFGLILETGQAAEVVDEIQGFVIENQFDEEPLMLLMRALFMARRKPDALRTFRAYEKALAEETGLEPSVEIRELEVSILLDQVEPLRFESRQASTLTLSINYVESDGRHIAVGRAGSGRSMVVHPGWLSKLDALSTGLDFRTDFWSRLSQEYELVIFDRYGTGLSRGEIDDFSIESSVVELRNVIEATTDPPSVVLAGSTSGPVGMQLAAESPELVDNLILMGTLASGPQTFSPAVAESIKALVRASWGIGSDVLAAMLLPGASAEQVDGFARFQREAATVEVASGFLEQLYSADVSHLLDQITVPTLVIHYRDDKAIPSSAGEFLARKIKDARYLSLDGITHYPPRSDYEKVMDAIRNFLDGSDRTVTEG